MQTRVYMRHLRRRGFPASQAQGSARALLEQQAFDVEQPL